MRNFLTLAALLTGCADNSQPELDVMPCADYSLTTVDSDCRVDLRGIDWTLFQRGPAGPSQQLPVGLASLHDDDTSTVDIYGGIETMWDGDPQSGIAVLVGQDGVSPRNEALTCAWVRCLEQP